MAKQSKETNQAPPDQEIIPLTEKQIEEIRSSRLDIAHGKFLENRLFIKEVKIWLKNR